MSLKIIGSGLGRTGTLSLKLALEQLGFTRCYHMVEVFMNPPHAELWIAAAHGEPQWDTLFEGYAATVDYPGARFWRSLVDRYPDAKVLHSVRDPVEWFESTQATIFSPHSPALQAGLPPAMQQFFEAVLGDIRDKLNDRDFLLDYFKRHTEEVVRTVAKDRLLVYEAGSGWQPLCRFLGVPVPTTPFPHENSREQFNARIKDGAPTPEKIRAQMEAELAHKS